MILRNIHGVREPTDPDVDWGRPKKEIGSIIDEPNVSIDRPHDDIKHVETELEPEAAVQTQSQYKSSNRPFKRLKVTSQISEEVTADMLAQKQQADPSLKRVRQLAQPEEQKE